MVVPVYGKKEITMGNVLIIAILIVIVICAISPTIKHFKGEGGCCGGGSTVKEKKKKLSAPQIGTKKIKIEGMHCKNCVNRVTNAVNQIDGAVCKVNLKKEMATICYSQEIPCLLYTSDAADE